MFLKFANFQKSSEILKNFEGKNSSSALVKKKNNNNVKNINVFLKLTFSRG